MVGLTAVVECSSRVTSGFIARVHVQSLEVFRNSQTSLDQWIFISGVHKLFVVPVDWQANRLYFLDSELNV